VKEGEKEGRGGKGTRPASGRKTKAEAGRTAETAVLLYSREVERDPAGLFSVLAVGTKPDIVALTWRVRRGGDHDEEGEGEGRIRPSGEGEKEREREEDERKTSRRSGGGGMVALGTRKRGWEERKELSWRRKMMKKKIIHQNLIEKSVPMFLLLNRIIMILNQASFDWDQREERKMNSQNLVLKLVNKI
jgi:hypothetical protein